MSRPQIFQQVKPNFGAIVTIITYQAEDHDKVIACQSTLESKIRQVLASDQDEVIFTDPIEGIWFGSLNKVKGNISLPPTYTKDDADYSSHLHHIMNSPPKKRPNSNLKRGGSLSPSTSSPYPNHNSSPVLPLTLGSVKPSLPLWINALALFTMISINSASATLILMTGSAH
jgi:hypothetical protein